jgi:ribosome maturation factor RimP
MEYKALESIENYADCNSIVKEHGFALVDLKIVPQKTQIHVTAVITGKAETSIGVDDCAKVHRILLDFLEKKLNSDDIYMEVTSPGMERNIKNAAEFPLFTGRIVRVWDIEKSDWVPGKIIKADPKAVTLEVSENESKCFLYEQIAKAKLLQI